MLNEDQKQKMEEENLKMNKNLSKIKYKIMVFSGKGGVGKSTVSVNLAIGLQHYGYRTGILDADITGPNVPKIMGISGTLETNNGKIIPYNKNGIKIVSIAGMIDSNDPVIWRGPLRSKLLNQFLTDSEWGELDAMIVDLPPGTGDEIITIGQKIKPDLAIIVTIPHELSLADSRRAINMAKKMDIPKIGLIENMAGFKCPNCESIADIFGFGGGESQAAEMGIKFLGRLPLSQEFKYGFELDKPFLHSYLQTDIMNIVHKLEGWLWKGDVKKRNLSFLMP
jgi:ATP-binding protein involved in chromosome partitioning